MKPKHFWTSLFIATLLSSGLVPPYQIGTVHAAPSITVSGLSFSASGSGSCSYTGGTYLDAGFSRAWNTANSPVIVDCNWSGSFSASSFTAGQTYYVKIVFTDSSGSVTGTSSYTMPDAPSTTSTTTTSTTTSTTTTLPGATEFVGVSFELIQLSENQFQVRPYISATRLPIPTPGGLIQTWSVTRGGSTVASGSYTSGSTALNSPNPFPMEVVNVTNLSANTTYVITMNAGISGNMVSGSRSITTNGSGWGSSTTTALGNGSTSSTITYNDPAPYMAQIDSKNVVTNVCVCSESFVRANPSRYPGTWVPMWMGVNGKNYAGPGWTYDPVAENFYPPTTTTTSTTASTIDSSSTSSMGDSTTVGTTKIASPDTSTLKTTAVPNGEARISVGGVEVEAETTVGKNAVTVSFGEVKAEISNKSATDDSTNTEAQQGLVLSSGESADVSIDGLQPNSEVEVVIYSTPRNLGSLQVNEFGELVASIEIPSNMESGSHTLVLKGLDKFGKQIELKFGLVVYSPDSYIPVWVWFLIGLLFILLALSFVSRRSKKA